MIVHDRILFSLYSRQAPVYSTNEAGPAKHMAQRSHQENRRVCNRRISFHLVKGPSIVSFFHLFPALSSMGHILIPHPFMRFAALDLLTSCTHLELRLYNRNRFTEIDFHQMDVKIGLWKSWK